MVVLGFCSQSGRQGISHGFLIVSHPRLNKRIDEKGKFVKVLVTGSAGFIGGYVVQELLDKGHQVIGIDNLSKYGDVTRSFDTASNYEFVNGDVQDVTLMTKLMYDVDHVIAGAALIGGISYFHTYAYDLLAQNERIIASTCDAAIATQQAGRPIKKVTYLSSSMVFESTDRWPSVEGDERRIAPPLSSYGFQKLSVEYFARAAWDQYKLPFTIVRPFNCVGIGERRALGDVEIESGNVKLAMSHVVPDLIQKILRGQDPVHILGDGSQVRHYTYGGDLAKGIVLAMESEKSLNDDFNLSTGEQTTVLELVKVIWDKINPGQHLEITKDPGFEYDVSKRVPSIEKSRTILGFEATTTLSEMLDEVIPWIQSAILKELI
jgi:nucleoside-diphosphate-sugar epimerase